MTRAVVYLNGAPVTFRSQTQKMEILSTSESELNAAVMSVQETLLMQNILKALGLKVKFSLLASIDNDGAVDIGNNWSIGRRTCHMEVKQNFQQELKEASINEYLWQLMKQICLQKI